MAVRITHAKVSAVTPIPSPTGIVTPTDWNDDHVVTGLSESQPGLANQVAYYSSDGTQVAGSSTVLVGSGSLIANSSANITVPIPYDYTSGGMVVHGGLSVLQNLQSRGTVFIGDGSSLAGFGGAFPGAAGQVGININGGTSAVGPSAGGYLDFDSANVQQMTIGTYGAVVNSTTVASFTPTWKSNSGAWLFVRSTATDGSVLAVSSGTATLVLGSTTIGGKVALTSTGAAGGVTTIAPAAGATFNFNLSSGAGTAGQPLLSGGGGTANQTYGTLTVPFGGTGGTSFTPNQVVTGGTVSSGPLQAVTAGTSGQVLTYVSSTALPTWQANAAAGSTLPYVMASSASGLAGARNLSGQSGVVSITDGGASSNITVGIATSGIGTTQLADLGVTTAKLSSNAVGDSKIRQSAGFSIIGNSTNAAANVADITGATDQVLRVSSAGTALGFGQINLASSNAVSNQLAVPFGGTGSSGFTANQVITAGTASSSPFQAVTAGTSAGQLLTWVSSSALPTWQTLTASASAITSGILAIPRGGTGNSSFTAYQLIAGGTASSLPLQALTPGTSGQVLTYVSSTALPTWQANAASGTVTAGSATQAAYYSSAGTSLAGSSTILISSGALRVNSTANISIPTPYDYTTGAIATTGGLSVLLNMQTRGSFFIGDGSSLSGFGGLPANTAGQAGININGGSSSNSAPAAGGYVDFDSNGVQQMTLGTYSAVVNSTNIVSFTPTWKSNGGGWMLISSTGTGGNMMSISSGTNNLTVGSSTLTGQLLLVSSNGGLTTTITPSTFATAVDFGPWTAYTPSVAPSAGALGTFTSTARYKVFGKTCTVQGTVSISSNGTAGGSLAFGLPFTANTVATLSGVRIDLGSVLWACINTVGSSLVFLLASGGGYPGSTGANIGWGGTFETV